MATFRDPDGNEWKLRLTTGSVADVKRETGVNLALTAKDANWVDAIFGDPGKLAEVLWVLCEAQAKDRDVTPERFPYLFDGPTIEAAGEALAAAIADFFPRSRIGRAIRENWGRAIAGAEDKVIAELNRASTGSPSPTSAPASSGATPAG